MDRHIFAAACLMAGTSPATAHSDWLTMGEAAYRQLKQAGHRMTIRGNRIARLDAISLAENLYVVEVNPKDLHGIVGTLHRELRHCGGFMYHASETDAHRALAAARPVRAVTRPSYAIANQTTVAPMLAQMDDARIEQTIVQLSNFMSKSTHPADFSRAANRSEP